MLSRIVTKRATALPALRAFSSTRTNQHYIDLDYDHVCHNYGALPVAIERGDGIYVWDVEGRRYYDFLCGYSSTNQGHCHPKIIKALVDQAHKLTQTSRAFHNTQMGTFSKYITNLLGFDKFLPSSAGVEACESAIKVARRWGYVAKGVEHDKASAIVANGCFWGRSITASGASDDHSRYNNFGPFTPGFHLVDYNNTEQIEAIMKKDPNLVAVMLEPIQGEAGVIIPDEGYLAKVKALCEQYNVLLIADEVQTGLGRTGKLMGYQWGLGDEVKPDIVTLGKAVSGGVTPVSGIVANDNIMDHIKPGDHGSTYGGNPLGMAVAKAAVEALVDEKMTENAAAMGAILADRFNAIESPLIKEVRSIGLFAAIEIHGDQKVTGAEFCNLLMKNGLLTKVTHVNAMRFAPALTISEAEVHAGADIVAKSIEELDALNASRM